MMSLRVLRVIEGQIDSNSKFRTIALSHDRTDASSDLLVRVRTCTYAYEC